MAEKEFQYKLTLASEADTSGIERMADAQESLNEEVGKGGFSGQAAGTAAYQESLEKTTSAVEDSTQTHEVAAVAVKEYVEKVDAAVESIEGQAAATQNMGKELEKIRALQQAQLLGELASGLSDVAKVAKNSGMTELAEDLEKASGGMRVAATIIQSGLGLSQLITQLGGVRAALGSAATFMTGPLGVALAAASAGFLLIQLAVKNASDEMDDFAEKAAEPVISEEAMERSKAAVDSLAEAIRNEGKELDKIIEKHEEELVLIKQKARLTGAQIDVDEADALADVDSREVHGKVTKKDAIIERAKIKNDADRKRWKNRKSYREKETAEEEKQAVAAEKSAEANRKRIADLERRKSTKARNFKPEERKRLREIFLENNGLYKDSKKDGAFDSVSDQRRAHDAKQQLEKNNQEVKRILQRAENPDRVYDSPTHKKDLEDALKKAKTMEDLAKKERGEADAKRKKNRFDQEEDDTRSGGRSRGRRSRRDDALERERQRGVQEDKRIADKKRSEEERENKKRLKGAEGDQGADMRSAAKQAKELAGKTNNKKSGLELKAALDQLARELGDGNATAAEIRAVQMAIGKFSASQLGAIKALLDEIKNQQNQINTLREQVKTRTRR